jgi:nitrogen fixation/metabolism regulation signal transduction histidine kinase
MRIPIPSFRIQIVILVLFLVINSALFFRNYFLDSFQAYIENVDSLKTNERINELYHKYEEKIDPAHRNEFKDDIDTILVTESQKSIVQRIFRDEIKLYSYFIFIFVTIIVLLLFLISFSLITKPLLRLMAATNEIARGNWSTKVRESRFSPLNELIISFNSMTSELLANRNSLIQAEKESAWRDMARVLAHEIKNPLTPIRLSIDRLESKYNLNDKDFDVVFDNVKKVVREEVDNLQGLATEFSMFARLPETNPTLYDMNHQLKSVSEPYYEYVQFKYNFDDNVQNIYADKNQMKQVFTNLIQNGIQSLGKNGVIVIDTKRKSDNILIKIQDNGRGIKPEDLDRIFDPYFTKREKGTGLGLAIVKRIIEQHSGTISVSSEIDIGTTFTLSLPSISDSEREKS